MITIPLICKLAYLFSSYGFCCFLIRNKPPPDNYPMRSPLLEQGRILHFLNVLDEVRDLNKCCLCFHPANHQLMPPYHLLPQGRVGLEICVIFLCAKVREAQMMGSYIGCNSYFLIFCLSYEFHRAFRRNGRKVD